MDSGQLPMTDWELVRKVLFGDHEAFHRLLDRHAPGLYGVAINLVGSPADAEDVLQETFAGAFRGLRTFRGQSSVKTWLTQILIRQAARHHRSRRRHKVMRLEQADSTMPVAPSAQRQADLRMDIAKAVQSLASEHREVIVLRELQGMSYDKMAEALGVPRGTVESRLFRARRALRDLLKEYFT
jgi:RNA polymerase sigma-70 factor (ECF subfamily)